MTQSIFLLNRGIAQGQGATGRLASDLIAVLRDHGINITARGVPHPPVRTPIGWLRDFATLIAQIMRAGPADIVVSMTDPPFLLVLGWWAARRLGARHIHWVQDLYPDALPALGIPVPAWMMAVMRSVLRPFYQRCERVVVIGACMRERLIADYRVDPDRITVIENWADRALVDIAHTPTTTPDPGGMRPSDPFTVFYGGTLGRAHPVNGLVSAIADLANDPVHFSFVGDQIRFQKKLGAVAGYHPSVSIESSLPTEDYASKAHKAGCHLVLMNEQASGCLVPSKAMTAFAVGRPILFAGPKTSALARMILGNQCGYVVDPEDGKAMAASIRRWRTDPDIWRSHAAHAQQMGRVYTPDRLLVAWIDLLDVPRGASDHGLRHHRVK